MIKTFVRAALDEQNAMKKAIVDSVSYIGCVIWCAGNVTPDNTIYCDGSAVSRTTYAELFDVIGTTYGAGDGSSTFNVPDLRGYFIRGTGGNAAALGAEQGDAIRNITGTFNIRNREQPGQPSGYDSTIWLGSGCISSVQNDPSKPAATVGEGTHNYPSGLVSFSASYVVPTAEENRPINKAINYIIVYE